MTYKNRIFAMLLVSAGAISFSTSAQANDQEENENHITIGGGVLLVQDPFIGSDVQANPFPYLSIRQDAFYLEGSEAGLTFDTDLGSVTPSLDLFGAARFTTGKGRGKVTADAGARLSLASSLGTVSVEYRRDVTDTFNGGEATARYSLPISMGRVTVTPAVQANWMDKKTTNYMYGVTAKQQDRMIEKEHNVVLPLSQIDDDAINFGGDITVAAAIDNHLTLFGMVSGTYLDKSIRNSAAIDQDWEASALVGVTYTF